jgi:hypothetical protein
VKFVATKKYSNKFFFHPSLVAVFGSENRNPGWVKIRMRDKHPGSATLFRELNTKFEIFPINAFNCKILFNL